MTTGEFRLRVVYHKAERLRHLSHLEVIHALERIIRRAGLPFAVTQGFSPHMKVAFGPALPVGTAGQREYFDVWLTTFFNPTDALRVLVENAPANLAPDGARYVAGNERSLTAELTIGDYEVEIDGEGIDADKVQAALAQVLDTGEFVMIHKGKQKVYDLACSVPKGACATDRNGGVAVRLAIRMGSHGSLRPEALITRALESTDMSVCALRTTRLDTFIEGDGGVLSRPV